MQRRKFLLGAGSLAAAGAAAMGTGAFNFANIERNAGIAVVDDTNAFLALDATSAYADDSSGQLKLTFNGDSTADGGGINVNSDYSFTGVFEITNAGENSVGVWIEDDESDGTNNVEWYSGSGFSNSIEGSGNATAVGPGSSLSVNVIIFNMGGDLPGTINIKADQSQG
ncbi:DUF1102 domain-containing protein [Halomarina oriensis]|uniref:DUF1102 domain-containing protein n=1 Tax=Halomarina oriensis TaxID=671145 RepID=A0A6B0GL76_9EURY|nr:DUF1102 domain-containing protein [Halomarina oriensis]MWG33543.1 DUF1102 domain-containing protein [Halomarina oriensis]